MISEPLVSCRKITKLFKGVQALAGVDFDIMAGTVHGLIGENGAGKSTLMKIVSGTIRGDSGELFIDGAPTRLLSAGDAINRKIVAIHQDSDLISSLTIAENIFLNNEPKIRNLPFISRKRILHETRDLLEEFGLDIDPERKVSELPADLQKMIQIVKAASKDARVLLMDEPTSSLTAGEVELLLAFVRRLASRGVGIVFISHYLPEVLAVCDSITILREGSVVRTLDAKATNLAEIIEAMIGRKIREEMARQTATREKEIFSVRGLSVKRKLHDVSFSLHEGEILGFTGLIGSGMTELAKTLFASEDVCREAGEFAIDGRHVDLKGPRDAVRKGLAFVPNDRKNEGLFGKFSVKDNICLSAIGDYAGRFGFLDRSRMQKISGEYIRDLAIKTPSPEMPVENLSGGNQQKVLLAKWLSTDPRILILDEPTTGIDVGTKFEIRRLIRTIADRGIGVILNTSEIEELEKLCDRVLVLFRGRIVSELRGAEISKEAVLKASVGEK